MHQKYDLKGSTYKRKANKYERKKESPTFKDLDFIEHHQDGILLESDTYNALIKTMQRDCRVLESFKIMDYSLLVGIHNLDQSNREKEERQREQANHFAELAAEELSQNDQNELNFNTSLQRTKSINKQRIAAYSTALESIQADIDPIDQEDDVPYVFGTNPYCFKSIFAVCMIITGLGAYRRATQKANVFFSMLESLTFFKVIVLRKN